MKIYEMSLQDCRNEQTSIRKETQQDIDNFIKKSKKERDFKIEMLDKRIDSINRKGIKKRMNSAMNSTKRR